MPAARLDPGAQEDELRVSSGSWANGLELGREPRLWLGADVAVGRD